jgi:hypothetical protein
MARNDIRIRNHRERADIERLTQQLITSDGIGFMYHSQPLINAFSELIDAELIDFDEQETRLYGAPRHNFTSEERRIQINRASDCALAHFNHYAPDKFRTALIELISESLAFADSIYQQRCGADEAQINQARPTAADLQQNVLWWSIQRQRHLPLQRKEDDSEWAETNAELQPMIRAVYEILNNLVIWAYDHARMQDLLREAIRPMVGKYDQPDTAAHNLANEAAELIWENIDGAAQMMSSTLVTCCQMLVFQSLEQQHNDTHPEDPIRIPSPISATRLKEIAAPFLDSWFEVMSVSLSKRGRPSRKPALEDIEAERAEFIKQVKAAIEELTELDRGNIGLKLGYGKSREGLEPTKEAAAKALREKAKRLEVDVNILIGEKKKKNRTQKSK